MKSTNSSSTYLVCANKINEIKVSELSKCSGRPLHFARYIESKIHIFTFVHSLGLSVNSPWEKTIKMKVSVLRENYFLILETQLTDDKIQNKDRCNLKFKVIGM